MFLDFIFGVFIAIPMLIGMLGYPWAVWKRLDRRFLNKRGVTLWNKVAVIFVALTPAVLTLITFGVLTHWLDVGGSSAAWERARAVAPRAVPPEAYPMAIGMVLGMICLAPLWNKLISKLPYLNVQQEPVVASRIRTDKAELHRLEWHVKSMFLPLKTPHVGAIPLAEIPTFANAPPHVRKHFYQDFLDADLLVIVKRTVGARAVEKKDIRYGLDTAIVAEDYDCLSGIYARDPVAKLKGAELLTLLHDHAGVLVNQPEIQVLFSNQDLKAISAYQRSS